MSLTENIDFVSIMSYNFDMLQQVEEKEEEEVEDEDSDYNASGSAKKKKRGTFEKRNVLQ